MTKRNLSITKILKQAAERVDVTGRNDITIGDLADDLGVQPSALYNHIDGLDGLQHDLAVHSTDAVANHLLDAVVAISGADAVRALAHAYRQFADQHPGQYASQLLPPAAPDDSLATAQQRIADVFVRVLSSTGLEGDAAVHAARIVRSAIHGFVTLESIDAFTSPVDRATSFDHLVEFLVTGLATA
ncbi:TetR/AcrR family transcriptional regulator [Ilumatobacter sp.]|uniref:TetR/AcrR family transcriptional regulator n=1 Tax=Ilumatobacter sp. TaxID=1967498 RepID=UPI0037529994